MTDAAPKPSHREWRKAAKKARRKKIRQQLAEIRKKQEKLKESSPTYLLELEKQRLFEEYEFEKEEKEKEERQLQWLKEEERAQKQFREEQRLKQLAQEEKIKEQEKIRKEWEKEQAKIKEEKERLEKLKKEEELRRQEILERINDFMCNGGDVPSELRIISETNPGKQLCSFYEKVGACRFGSQCSRNHQYFKISNVLLITNFYSHFTLDQSKTSEYDTDISLEYEDSDKYSHFREFYNDIVPEFKKFGEVTMVKVCCNTEFHLRGNVYVEYQNEREALVAYKAFQGRWYGGKLLSIEFVKIRDWGSAVCGDFARRKCPKGNSCNFLHVFKNPRNEFPVEWIRNKNNSIREGFDDRSERSRDRHWRWSETPELSPSRLESSSSAKKRDRSISRHSKERRNGSLKRRKRSRSSERKRSRSSERKRSRSSERKRSRSSERKRSRSSERKRSRSSERKRSRSSERKRSRSTDRKKSKTRKRKDSKDRSSGRKK